MNTENNGKKKEPSPAAARKQDTFYFDELLPDDHANIFLLARVAMTRAMEIHMGSRPLVEHEATDKEATIALREIVQGKVTFGKKKPKEEISGELAAEAELKGALE
jgi:DNA-directed RNA polymerase omega subunit